MPSCRLWPIGSCSSTASSKTETLAGFLEGFLFLSVLRFPPSFSTAVLFCTDIAVFWQYLKTLTEVRETVFVNCLHSTSVNVFAAHVLIRLFYTGTRHDIGAQSPWPTFQSAVSELRMGHCSNSDPAVLAHSDLGATVSFILLSDGGKILSQQLEILGF